MGVYRQSHAGVTSPLSISLPTIYLEICSFPTKGLLLLEHGPNCRLTPSHPLPGFARFCLWNYALAHFYFFFGVVLDRERPVRVVTSSQHTVSRSRATRLDRVLKTSFSRIGVTNCKPTLLSWSVGGGPPYNILIESRGTFCITTLCPLNVKQPIRQAYCLQDF